jgi:hypothetical protein
MKLISFKIGIYYFMHQLQAMDLEYLGSTHKKKLEIPIAMNGAA